MAAKEVRRVALAVLLLVTVSPALSAQQRPDPSSLTDEQRDELGSLLKRAKDAYEGEKFRESIAALEAAYGIFPEPNILYRIGDAYERLGELEPAIEYYRRYVTAAPEASDANLISRRIEDLQRRVDELRAEVDAPEVDRSALLLDTNPTGAKVFLDGEQTEHLTPVRVEVEPGPHQIELRLEGYRALGREVEIEAGETLSLVYQLDALPVEAPAELGPGPWPWVVGGVGAASIVTGGVFLGLSLSAGSKVRSWDEEREAAYEMNASVPPRPDGYNDAVRNEVTFRNVAIATAGAGVLLAAAGGVWLALGAERSSAAVRVGLGGHGVALNGRF